jgi:hypothetical protein
MSWLKDLADVATIVTAIVAVIAAYHYILVVHRRMRAIERELKKKTQPNDDSLTVDQLAIAIKATEEQVIEAAGRSSKIEGWGGQTGNERRFKLIRKK